MQWHCYGDMGDTQHWCLAEWLNGWISKPWFCFYFLLESCHLLILSETAIKCFTVILVWKIRLIPKLELEFFGGSSWSGAVNHCAEKVGQGRKLHFRLRDDVFYIKWRHSPQGKNWTRHLLCAPIRQNKRALTALRVPRDHSLCRITYKDLFSFKICRVLQSWV